MKKLTNRLFAVAAAVLLAGGLTIGATTNAGAITLDPTNLTDDGGAGDGSSGGLSWDLQTCDNPACSPATDVYLLNQTPGTANPDAADILLITGDVVTELYKDNVGGSESGSFAGSYTTTYNGDLSGGSITYDGGPAIGDPLWLVVKDGAQTPEAYLFDISTWNGTDTITLAGFWPNQGAVSHVSIFGGEDNDVPEPGTLAVFGAGLVALAIARRRRKLAA